MRRFIASILFLFLLCALSGLDVSGAVNGIWSFTGEPYNVVGNLIIENGQELLINHGVTVNVTGNYTFTVQGLLRVFGTAADSVRFTLAPGNDLWQGIRIESQAQSIIRRAYIEKAEYGVNSVLGRVEIDRCRFSLNKKAIQAYGIGSNDPPQVLIQNSIIENSRENGIFIVQNGNTTVTGCEIRYNGTMSPYRGAIQLSNQSAGGSNNPTITDNHIHHNLWQGLIALDNTGTNAINPNVSGNIIEYNYTGIYLMNASGNFHHNQIRDNFIPGNMNSGAGVMVSGATSAPFFASNIITGNYTGFYITHNANPCLGNQAINHIWAYGDNIIQNNIDANSVRHSVYCVSYPQSGNTIFAENNIWDYADATQIGGTVNDHADNSALPTVDYDPFNPFVTPVFVNFAVEYEGTANISDTRFELISPTTGEVLLTQNVTPGVFNSLPVYFGGMVYAVAYATVNNNPSQRVWATVGTMEFPEQLSLDVNASLTIGTLTLSAEQPCEYMQIGAPEWFEGHQIYPVRHGKFVYAYDYIDHIYLDGGYLYLAKHTRRLHTGLQTWVLPAQSIWFANYPSGTDYVRNEVVDSLGSIVSTNMLQAGIGGPLGLFIADELAISRNAVRRWHMPESCLSDTLYVYEMLGNLVDHAELLYPVSVEGNGGFLPLVENNLWHIRTLPTEPHPNKLVYVMDAEGPKLYWLPPAHGSGAWTHYRIYRDNTLYTELPLGTTSFDDPEFAPDGYQHTFYVTAWDGQNESAPTATVLLSFLPNQDDVASAPRLRAYPNPCAPGAGFPLRIELINAAKTACRIDIYNLRGQNVKTIDSPADGQTDLIWNGSDNRNQPVAPGIYFLRAAFADGTRRNLRLLLLK